jgi:ABC-type multidrug transport system fused ATPase/permease subunit
MLTIALSGFMRGTMGDIIDQNARYETGHLKIMTRAYAENKDQLPNDLGFIGVNELLDSVREQFPDVLWVKRIRFGGLIDVPDSTGNTRAQGPAAGMALELLNKQSGENERLNISKSLVTGTIPQQRGQAIIGHDFSEKLNLHVGDTITYFGTDALMALPQERQAKQRPLDRTQLQGALELRQVTFSYPGQSTPALAGVSLRLNAGERVGIIGRNGSGKSTLARLLMAFYSADEGQILLDNIDLRQLDVADLRHQIGYVAHDLPLLAGSLRDNLTLGARYINDARMLEVAEMTGVVDLARQHPQGFDRPVGERGQLLSSGQRQAVLLARSLLLDPPVLVLDEPTSSMDNTSEDLLRTRLQTCAQGKTLLLITHRASMLSLVDRLIVLDNGHIVADGPKEAVIEALRKGRVGPAAV